MSTPAALRAAQPDFWASLNQTAIGAHWAVWQRSANNRCVLHTKGSTPEEERIVDLALAGLNAQPTAGATAIPRYRKDVFGDMVNDSESDADKPWVLYTDHAAEVARLKAILS